MEEEFKKHSLARANGTSSSTDRLKQQDLSAPRDLAAAGSTAGFAPAAADLTAASAAANGGNAPAPYEEASPFGAVNLPAASEGYHPLEFYPTSRVDLDWGVTSGGEGPLPAMGGDRARCFVILFGVGRAETEGIYSLRAVAKEDGLPVDTIVAFENEDDASRYSTLLEATMDHEPTVWPIEWGELLDFCNTSGYRCRLEPAGSLLIPPDYNVGMTDWEKSLRLRKGEFSVLGAEEPAGAPPAGEPLFLDAPSEPLFLDAPSWVFEPDALLRQDEDVVQAERISAVIDSQLASPAALQALRANLERMLPSDSDSDE